MPSTKPLVIIRAYYPDPDLRTYHVNDVLKDAAVDEPPSAPPSNTEMVNEFGERLRVIKGVAGVLLFRCGIAVRKNFVYEWSEVEPLVLEHIKQYLGWQDREVSISTLNSAQHPIPPDDPTGSFEYLNKEL